MKFIKENWLWIVMPILAVIALAIAAIVLSNRDGLGNHRYDDLSQADSKQWIIGFEMEYHVKHLPPSPAKDTPSPGPVSTLN